jgi:hypothetical protein
MPSLNAVDKGMLPESVVELPLGSLWQIDVGPDFSYVFSHHLLRVDLGNCY